MIKKIFDNKHAELIDDWGEILVISTLIIGFIISYFSLNQYYSYAIIFIIGFGFGRSLYNFKNMPKTLIATIIICFFIGFLIGSSHISKTLLFTFFIVGVTISYLLHYKKIII